MEQGYRLKSIAQFDQCYGCGVCVTVCPKNAISLELNDSGFLSTVVDDSCVGCSKCLQVCAFNFKNGKSFPAPIDSFAAWSNRPAIRDKSTTGGVIYELCEAFIRCGYKICAVRYNYQKRHTEHFVFDSMAELEAATGSKYLQSYSSEALSSLDWIEGKYVIVGAPCMISSLRQLVKRQNASDRILLVDFFCHGVPSYLMWEKYEQHVSSMVGDIECVTWRNKDNGWQDSTAIKIKGTRGRYLSFLSKGDMFFSFFLKNRCLNECCYDDCVFKLTNSDADIRVGDMWGAIPEYVNNRLGVNSILVFTHNGMSALNECDNIYLKKEDIATVLLGQISKSPPRPKSFKYVKKALLGDATLSVIHKKAYRIERFYDHFRLSYYRARFNNLLVKMHLK